MKTHTLKLMALMCAVAFTDPSFAATLRVPSQYSTIQAAINAAAAGDTVLLASGTYTGAGNRDVDFLGTPLVLTSEEGRDSTIIDCQDSGRAFDIHSNIAMPTVISGIEIKKGAVAEAFGGGIRIVGASVRIEDTTIRNCSHDWLAGGGGVAMTNSSVAIIRSTFASNRAPEGSGGNISVVNSTLRMDSCEVVSGWVLRSGGGIFSDNTSEVRITNTLLAGNGTGNGCCGGAIANSGQLSVFNSVFRGNVSYHGACIDGGVDSLVSCVFEGNRGSDWFGHGIIVDGGASYVARNTITGCNSDVDDANYFAGYVESLVNNLVINDCGDWLILDGNAGLIHGNTFILRAPVTYNPSFLLNDTTTFTNNLFYDESTNGVMFDGTSAGLAQVSCSNIYTPNGTLGPAFADAGRNSYVDPLFCDYAGDDFSLSSASPCLSASCGQIGAFGHGCWTPGPGVIEVSDVGSDQGGQVRLKWLRSQHDAPGAPEQITGYSVYRREDANLTVAEDPFAASGDRPDEPARLAGWDYLATQPAYGDSLYQMVVPTLCDSTESAGVCWSSFMVRAATPNPFTYFDSPPDSGYSSDNVAPAAPQNVVAAYNTGYGNDLSWNMGSEPDLSHYNVYRGTVPGFNVGEGELIGQTGAGPFTDPSYDGWVVHYMVTAVDFAGNEGPAAGPNGAVTGAQPIPSRLSLLQNYPNPFNPVTSIDFTLPQPGIVRLAVYDVAGRRVRTLVDGRLERGPQSVQWDGRNDAGVVVGSGVYFCRLETRAGTVVRSMTLVK